MEDLLVLYLRFWCSYLKIVFLESHLLLIHRNRDVSMHRWQLVDHSGSSWEVVLGSVVPLVKVFPNSVYLLFINFECLGISCPESEDSLEKFRNDLMSMVLNIFVLKITGQVHFHLETLDFHQLALLRCSQQPIYLFILSRERQLVTMGDDTIWWQHSQSVLRHLRLSLIVWRSQNRIFWVPFFR